MNLQEQWQRSISDLHSYSTAGEETFRNHSSLYTLRENISVLCQLRVLIVWFFPSVVISWKQPRKAISNDIFFKSHVLIFSVGKKLVNQCWWTEATDMKEMEQDGTCLCCFSMPGIDLHQHLHPSLTGMGSYLFISTACYWKTKLHGHCKFFCAHQQKLAFHVNEECLRCNYIKNME